MGVKEKEKEKKRGRWWRNGFSCFGGEIECELSGMKRDMKLVPKKIWKRIVGTKKTVPEQSDSDVSIDEMKKHISDDKKNFDYKGKNKAVMIHENRNSIHKASKCDYRTELSPLYKMLDPVKTQTQTRLSHSGSPQSFPVTKTSPQSSPVAKTPERKALRELDFTKGISVLTIIILLVIFFGKSFAILCVCIWFYVVLRLRTDVAEKEKDKENEIKKKTEDEVMDSDLYKRMVVFRGFMERDKKRPVHGK